MVTRPLAYRVPFLLEREPERHAYRLTNTSAETVHGVAFTLHGSGVMAVSPPRVLRPDHGIEVTIAVRSLAANAILVIRWFRPNGTEYLWRVSF
jgi:hypothetical protein